MKRADALGVMAEGFLAHGDAMINGGDRCQIVVHVDAETLRESVAGRCEIEEGPSLAAETARRLACDASIVAMVEDEDGEPLSVGRKTRSIPPSLRRALNARDGGCRFPGCTHKRYVDAHHIEHWAHGGETKASNLVTLCKAHHRAVHEGRIVVVRCESPVVRTEGSECGAASAHNGNRRTDNGRLGTAGDGALRFVRPNGQSFDSIAPGHTRPFTDWKQLPAIHQQHGIHIDRKTAATRWCGESMDFGLAIEVLLQQSKRRRGVS